MMMSLEKELTRPAEEGGISNISRMRLALGLLDITAIKKSLTEQMSKDKELQSPKKKSKHDMISSAKLPNNENHSPLKL